MPSDTILDDAHRTAWVERDRAAHYRSIAERLEKLAQIETQPRVQQRLLELAGDYLQLAAEQIKRTVRAL